MSSKRRVNAEIIAQRVWLEAEKREASLGEALRMASERNADLLEFDPEHDPPRCSFRSHHEAPVSLSATRMPTPLALALNEYEKESHPFSRVHRLIDVIEVLVKLHTVAVVSDYFSREKVSEELKGLLGAGLRTPSLGIWWQFLREACKALEGRDPFLVGAERYILSKGPLFKRLEGENNLIAFRNSYAHGATPPPDRCSEDINRYAPVVTELIRLAGHWESAELVVTTSDGKALLAAGMSLVPTRPPEETVAERCYVRNTEGQALCLHPLLVFRESSGRFFFYNDLRENDAVILNYDACIHERDTVIREHLLQRYPIDCWGRSVPEQFKERLEQLTEVFKGRRVELRRIMDFTAGTNRGFLMVWGGPGIGKSSLLARAIQVMRWTPEMRESDGMGGGDTAIKLEVLEYFIRRGELTANADYLLDNLNSRLARLLGSTIPAGRTTKERGDALRQNLRLIGNKLKPDRRLVLFIDGLDEGVDAPNLLEVLPKDAPENVLVIYASRDHLRVRDTLYDYLDREHHEEMSLQGLTTADVRAMLMDHINKYAIRQEYVDTIVERSLGNPLYVKLLCGGLEKGEYNLNDRHSLPKGLAEMYDNILRRLCDTPDACDLLCLLAAARDFMSAAMLSEGMNKSVHQVSHRILRACMEVLAEDPATESVAKYQLFHESLREHLWKSYEAECRRWQAALSDWCQRWNDGMLSRESGAYTVRFLISHLKEQYDGLATRGNSHSEGALQKMTEAVESDTFRAEVFRRCGNAISLQHDIKIVQRLLVRNDQDDAVLWRVLNLARLFHEEPQRRYDEQVCLLEQKGKGGDLTGVEQLALMGNTSRARTLLALRALFQRDLAQPIPDSLRKSVSKWIEESKDSALAELWKCAQETVS